MGIVIYYFGSTFSNKNFIEIDMYWIMFLVSIKLKFH